MKKFIERVVVIFPVFALLLVGGAVFSISIPLAHAVATPTVQLSASQTWLPVGQSSTLTWSSTNATSCTASGGWTGSKSVSAGTHTQTVTPTANNTSTTITYSLVCSGAGGTSNLVSVRIEVIIGRIYIFRVDQTGNNFMAGTQAKIDANEQTLSVAHPASFTDITLGAHTAYATDLAGYDEYVAQCVDSLPVTGYTPALCSPNPNSYSKTGVTCANGFCSVSVNVNKGQNSKVFFKYVPIATDVTPVNITPSNKFTINDAIKVTGNAVNVRNSPSTSATLSTTPQKTPNPQPLNATGKIANPPSGKNPTLANDYWWWYVNYDSGADGWSVENYLTKYTPVTILSPSITVSSAGTGDILIDPSLTSTSNAIFAANVTGGSGQYKYYWNFGDRSVSNGSVLQGNQDTMGHRYSTAGTYTISVYVIDSNNRTSNTVTITRTARLMTQPSVIVLSPNGGETINLNDAIAVTFKPIIGSNHQINLVDESRNTAYDLDIIGGGNGITGQSTDVQNFSVIIPPNHYLITPGSRFKIEICSTDRCDKSDSYFTIAPPTTITTPSITVLSPAEGETWRVGDSKSITWRATGQSGLGVDLYLAHPMGGYCYLGTDSASTGRLNFKLSENCVDNGYVKPPQSSRIISGQYKVLANLQNGDARVPLSNDFSDSFIITIPQTIPIKSISIDASNNIHFSFSQIASACLQIKDSQGNYFALTSSQWSYSCANSTLFTGYQTELVIPRSSFSKTIIAGQYYRVCNSDTRGNSYAVCSDSILVTSSPQPSITVLGPNGGEEWYFGNSYDVTWSSNGVGRVLLYACTNVGQCSLFPDMGSGISNVGRYSIVADKIPCSGSCKIRVNDATNRLVSDDSNNYVSLLPANKSSITVTSPRGGDTIVISRPFNIEWTRILTSGDERRFDIVKIENGVSTTIASNLRSRDVGCESATATCSYAWTPSALSSNVRIAINKRNTNDVAYSGYFSVVSTTQSTGSVLIRQRNNENDNIPEAQAKIDGTLLSNNPAIVSGLSTGSHTAYTTKLLGWDVYGGTCSYPVGGTECMTAYTGLNVTCTDNYCSIPIRVDANTVTKVLFTYAPTRAPAVVTTVVTTPVVTVLPWTISANYETATVGSNMNYTLNWSGGPLDKSWSTFVHFVKNDNQNIMFGDGFWPSPATNSSSWSGSVSTSRSGFVIPANTPLGTYKVMVGLYDGPTRLNTLVAGSGVSADSQYRYQVGTITIRANTSLTPTAWNAINWDAFKALFAF